MGGSVVIGAIIQPQHDHHSSHAQEEEEQCDLISVDMGKSSRSVVRQGVLRSVACSAVACGPCKLLGTVTDLNFLSS